MTDILLSKSGDLVLTENGDILLEDSIAQAIQIQVRWVLGEWRFDPDMGIDYFGKLLKKNPDLSKIKSELRKAIFNVDGVMEVRDVSASYDRKTRIAKIQYTAVTDYETIRGEVNIDELRGD